MHGDLVLMRLWVRAKRRQLFVPPANPVPMLCFLLMLAPPPSTMPTSCICATSERRLASMLRGQAWRMLAFCPVCRLLMVSTCVSSVRKAPSLNRSIRLRMRQDVPPGDWSWTVACPGMSILAGLVES